MGDHITNESMQVQFCNIPTVEKNIAARQLTFVSEIIWQWRDATTKENLVAL